MDIRDWSLDKIMQLPDCAFGRRWPMVVCRAILAAAEEFYLFRMALPEWTVFWELRVWCTIPATTGVRFGLALGQVAPADLAEFKGLEPVFPCIEDGSGQIGMLDISQYSPQGLATIRHPVKTASRRLIYYGQNPTAAAVIICLAVVISSVPREVPDWMCSLFSLWVLTLLPDGSLTALRASASMWFVRLAVGTGWWR